jgi:hypothetical protein
MDGAEGGIWAEVGWKEEAALRNMSDGLNEVRSHCGMEINVEKSKLMRLSGQPSQLQIMIEQKQPQNAEYLNCLGSPITNDAIRTRETKYRIAIAKAAFNKKTRFTNKRDLNAREKTSKVLHLEHSFVWC